MSKYNWAKVPKETQYIATEADGYAHGWNGEPPEYCDDYLGWVGEKSKITMFMLKPNENPVKGDWQDSLEERPK